MVSIIRILHNFHNIEGGREKCEWAQAYVALIHVSNHSTEQDRDDTLPTALCGLFLRVYPIYKVSTWYILFSAIPDTR